MNFVTLLLVHFYPQSQSCSEPMTPSVCSLAVATLMKTLQWCFLRRKIVSGQIEKASRSYSSSDDWEIPHSLTPCLRKGSASGPRSGHWRGRSQVRRSMHQDCLLKPRNYVFYPFFTHFPPFFAHFLRLDARNPGNMARRPGGNGKKSEKNRGRWR